MNVAWTTESVEYPATLRTGIPLSRQASRSILFTPVAASHTSFREGAASRSSLVTFTLLIIKTLQSATRCSASSGVDVGQHTSSPRLSMQSRGVSPTVDASRNTIFISVPKNNHQFFPALKPVLKALAASSLELRYSRSSGQL